MIYSSITEKIHPVPIHASQTVSLLSSEISHLRQPRPYSQHCIHDSLILIRVPPSGVWIRHLREVFLFSLILCFCHSCECRNPVPLLLRHCEARSNPESQSFPWFWRRKNPVFLSSWIYFRIFISCSGVHHITFWQKVTKTFPIFHASFCYLFPALFPKSQKLLPLVVRQFVILHGNIRWQILKIQHNGRSTRHKNSQKQRSKMKTPRMERFHVKNTWIRLLFSSFSLLYSSSLTYLGMI